MEKQTHRFTWRGIEIEAVYEPQSRCDLSHLEIRSLKPDGAPLPITETGYLSHFHRPGTLELMGGDVVAQVVAWLDDAATSPAWRRHEQDARQLSLF